MSCRREGFIWTTLVPPPPLGQFWMGGTTPPTLLPLPLPTTTYSPSRLPGCRTHPTCYHCPTPHLPLQLLPSTTPACTVVVFLFTATYLPPSHTTPLLPYLGFCIYHRLPPLYLVPWILPCCPSLYLSCHIVTWVLPHALLIPWYLLPLPLPWLPYHYAHSILADYEPFTICLFMCAVTAIHGLGYITFILSLSPPIPVLSLLMKPKGDAGPAPVGP